MSKGTSDARPMPAWRRKEQLNAPLKQFQYWHMVFELNDTLN